MKIFAFAFLIAVSTLCAGAPAFAQVKTAKACDDEYATNKSAIKAAKEKKKDFVAACRALPVGQTTPIASAPITAAPRTAAPTSAPTSTGTALTSAGQLKTAKSCDDEYAANKPSIKAARERKKDYISACRALPVGQATPIGSAAAAPSSQAAPAPPVATPAPAPTPTVAPAPAPAAPASTTARTQPRAPSTMGTPTTAGQFSTEAQAKASCPSDQVVWLNTKTNVYHFAGYRNYGSTRQGAYICQQTANAAGDRAAKNEKQK